MKVKNGEKVEVHYVGTFEDGTEFDNSRKRDQPLEFRLGTTRIIKGFNDAVVGMTVGETKTIHLTAEQAYGPVNPKAFNEVPKTQFDEDFVFEAGRPVMGQGPNGPFRATIHEVYETHVVMNYNHPLAGKNLTFEIELVARHSEEQAQMANWNTKMKKAELFEIAKSQGLSVNTRSTKAQIIKALQA